MPGNAPREPLASWDCTAACWLAASGMSSDLFGQSEPFSGRWPVSGMTRNGRLYPLPTLWGHRIAASEFSSSPGLLPTPTAKLAQDSQTHRSGARTDELLLTGVAKALTSGSLLPTPTAHDDGKSPEAHMAMKARMPGGERKTITSLSVLARNEMRQPDALLKTPTAQLAVNGGSQHPDKRREGGHGPTLADQVEHELLPTPRATDGTKGGPNQRGSSGDLMLPSAVMGLLPTPNATDWKGGNIPLGRMKQGRPRTIGDADLPAAIALLPTPLSADGGSNRGSSAGFGLRNVSREIWRGEHTSPPSADGKPSPADPLQGQLSLDEPESA